MNFPELNEYVVCKITKILDYGVFADLVEYPNTSGFVHISQVASGWIKNIRNFAKENEIRVAKVLHVDAEKKQIDLSFTKVSSSDERARLDTWKKMKRAQKLIEIIAKEKNSTTEEAWEFVAQPLLEKYNSLHDAFQAIALNPQEASKPIQKEWLKPALDVITKNIEIPNRTIQGVVALSSFAPNGIELIKDALISAQNSTKDAEISIYYAGSGKYVIRVSSFDYKVAERVLKFAAGNAIESIKAAGGTGSFEKSEL